LSLYIICDFKSSTSIVPVIEKLGAVSIVTYDGYNSLFFIDKEVRILISMSYICVYCILIPLLESYSVLGTSRDPPVTVVYFSGLLFIISSIVNSNFTVRYFFLIISYSLPLKSLI